MTAEGCHWRITDGCQLVSSPEVINLSLSLPYFILLLSASSSVLLSLRPSCSCVVRVSCPSLPSKSSGLHPSGGPRDWNFCRFVEGKYSMAPDRFNAQSLLSCYRGPHETSALSKINKSQWIKAHQRRALSKVHMKLIWHNQLTADSGSQHLSAVSDLYDKVNERTSRRSGSVDKLVTNTVLLSGPANALFWMLVTK